MMQDQGSMPPVGVRADGGYVVVTVTPQQAHELAQVIARSEVQLDGWLEDVADSLIIEATQLDPMSTTKTRHLERVAHAESDTSGPDGASGSASPDARPVSGLAAALAVFTQAIGGDAGVPAPPIRTRTETTAAARTRALQEILSAAEAHATIRPVVET